MTADVILTNEGLEKLKKELTHLKRVRRPEIAERIRHAKDFGDLSENAEYHEAKEEQAFVEGRIIELEHLIKIGHVVTKPGSSEVGVGSEVYLERDGVQYTFTIVGATESDPSIGKISLESPLGQSLLGKKVKDVVELTTPGGVMRYTIKTIH